MTRTKIRAALGAVTAIVIIVVMLAMASVQFGWNIPILHDLALQLGFGNLSRAAQ